MQQSNINNEKIRSILSAMERSIDVARRKRLNQSDDVSTSRPDDHSNMPHEQPEHRTDSHAHDRSSQPSHPNQSSSSNIADRDTADLNGENCDTSAPAPDAHGSNPPRLKARPKRPSAFFHPPAEQGWQSRAG